MANRAIYGPPRPRPPASPGLLQRFQGAMQQPGGLLGSNPLLGMGIGLLSQGPSLTPINPLQGLGAGFGLYNQARQQGMQQQLAERRLGLQERELEADEAAARQAAEQAAAQRKAQVADLIAQGHTPEDAERQVAAGAYAPAEVPNAVQVANWYAQATPEEQAAFRESRTPGVELTMGEKPEPVGENAPNWVLPDGSEPHPGMPVESVIAAGGRPLSKAEQAARTKAAVREEQQQSAQELVDEALSEWEKRYTEWENNPTPENKRKVDEQRLAVGLARQALLNQERELSGAMQRQLAAPGAWRRRFEKGVEDVMGQFGIGEQPGVPLPPEETIPRSALEPQPLPPGFVRD